MRSFASNATVQAWRHSPSTKRMTVPLGPDGPGGPAGPAGPGGPGSPFSAWETFSSQAESARGASSKTMINQRTCMRSPRGYQFRKPGQQSAREKVLGRGNIFGNDQCASRADLFGGLRGSAGQTLRQGARHVGRHLHANDRAHGAVPIVEQVQHDFDVLVEDVGGCEFRRAEVMRRRPSEFRDHDVLPVRPKSSRCGQTGYGGPRPRARRPPPPAPASTTRSTTQTAPSAPSRLAP